MKENKTNIGRIILFILLVIMAVFAMWMIGKGHDCAPICKSAETKDGQSNEICRENQDCSKYTLTGWTSLFISFALFILLFFKKSRKKIPFDIIKKKYIQDMEKKEQITISPRAETMMMTEENDRYVFVLKDESMRQDNIPTYFMCEANMYDGILGRGFGSRTQKVVEAEYWFRTRKKMDVTQAVADEIRKQTIRELTLKTREQQAAMQRPGEQEFKG